MIATNEIYPVTILITYSEGEKIVSKITPFKIIRQEHRFRAIPLVPATEKKQAGLPDEFSFSFREQKIEVEREINRQTLEAIKEIVRELNVLRLL